MLHKGERYEILKALRTCFQFGFLPGQVELSSWELLPLDNKSKIWKCRLWFFVFCLHAIYKMGSLASAYLLHADTFPLHEMIIHSCIAAAGLVYILWYYVLFVQYPGVFALYFNMTLMGKTGVSNDVVEDEPPRSWSRRLQEFTLHDWYAMSLPYILPSTTVTIMAALVCYPSMKLMLYNAVPMEFGKWGWVVFGILLVEEFRFLTILVCYCLPVLILQIISFDLVNDQLNLLINSMHRAARAAQNLKNVYKSLRCMQLYMINVNLINRFIIFSMKVLFIFICVCSGYAAIAHFSDYPVFGVMYYMMLLNVAIIYIFSYDKAFKIPVLFEEARQHALFRVGSSKSVESKIFKKQMGSIPRMGVQVGEFHTMERVSTIVFIHFVVNNIVNMLVANRHN